MTDRGTAGAGDDARLALAERILVHSFDDQALLRRALTHPSYSFEAGTREQYERLEFLGDSVLGLVVTDHLYRTFPDFTEGSMAKLRSTLVSGRMLARLAGELGLADALFIGHSAEQTGGRRRASVLADCFEATVGALYLDAGLDAARRFILDVYRPSVLPEALDGVWRDHKSTLQEHTLGANNTTPVYRIVSEEGPPHDRMFTAEVLVNGQVVGVGRGPSKKDAEKAAAEAALHQLDLS